MSEKRLLVKNNHLSQSRRNVMKLVGSTVIGSTLATTSGSAQSVTQIEDWNDLNAIRNDLNGDYELANDLEEDTPGYDEHGDGFKPIGSEEPFTGIFDGSEQTIFDLTIDPPDEEGVGLFGTVDDATIQNLILSDATINGDSYVGTVVGIAEGETTVEGITADGTVEGSGDKVGGVVGESRDEVLVSNADSAVDVTGRDDVGGVVGENDDQAAIRDSEATGTIEWRSEGSEISGAVRIGGIVAKNDAPDATVENCRSDADVQVLDNYVYDEDSGENGSVHAGAIAGTNDGLIEKCVTTGTVTVEDNPDTHPEENRRTTNLVGGIVGHNSGDDPQECIVRQCYSDATITVSDSVGPTAGGITGVNFGTIEDSYATGAIDTTEGDFPVVGGLVGRNSGFESDGVIERCFAAVDFSIDTIEDSPLNLGGVIGDNRPETEASDLYWDTDVSNADVSIDGYDGTITNITGLSTAEIQGEAAAENMDALDFDETWDVVTDPADYPVLAWQDEPVDEPTDGEIEGDITITLNNVGVSAWEVTSIDGDDDVASTIEDNPTLTLKPGERYVIENDGRDGHPLEFRDETGGPLLSQSNSGEFEDDSEVEWVNEDDELAFTLTEELADAINSYICTIHHQMEGDIQISTEEDEEVEAPGDVTIPAEYVRDNGQVGPSGLGDAAADFRSNKIDPGTLGDVAAAFRNSS
ncbi:GLUG motif-containing protein [Halonotius roseus]|nr:GLUG motif-containing protein [Halonotius roseus]